MADPAELENKLLTFVTDTFLFGQRGDLAAETMLLEKGIVDSTGVLEVIGFLESDFGVAVDDAEILPENLDSIARIAAFVAKKKG